MAESTRISQLSALDTPTNQDVLIINDVSDNTQSEEGSTKRITVSDLMSLSVDARVTQSQANWNTTYTTTDQNSANWDTTYTTTNQNSANWNTAYTTVTANSATWASGGSSGGTTISTSTGDTSVAVSETSTVGTITFTTSGTDTWKIENGALTPVSGYELAEFGSPASPPANAYFSSNGGLWLGDWNKVYQDTNRTIAIRTRNKSTVPAVVKHIENNGGETFENWAGERRGLDSGAGQFMFYYNTTLDDIVEYVHDQGPIAFSVSGYDEYTLDDIIPSLGQPGYTADDWESEEQIVQTIPNTYKPTTIATDAYETDTSILLDMNGGKPNIYSIGGNSGKTTTIRVKYDTTNDTHMYGELLVINMTDDFDQLYFEVDRTGNLAADNVYMKTTGSYQNTTGIKNECLFKVRVTKGEGTGESIILDSTQLQGNENDAYNSAGDKFYVGGSYDLYKVLDENGDPITEQMYVYTYDSNNVITRFGIMDANNMGALTDVDPDNITVTGYTTGGYVSAFTANVELANLYVEQIYHQYSTFSNTITSV